MLVGADFLGLMLVSSYDVLLVFLVPTVARVVLGSEAGRGRFARPA